MKTGTIIRLIVFAVIAVVLLCILLAGIGLGKFLSIPIFTGGSSAPIVEATAFRPEDIDALQIDWVAGNVYLTPADQEEITVTEDRHGSDDPMVIRQNGSELIVEFSEKNFIGSLSPKKKDLHIAFPADWRCEKLEIDAVSARVEAQELTAGKVTASTVSGNFFLENCTADEMRLDSVSGNLTLSGAVKELRLSGVSARADVTVSGAPQEIRADSVSGSLNLTLPADSGFTLEKDTLSGSFSTDFVTTQSDGKIISGEGACTIKFSGLSADIHIRQAQ